ncbi:MAG: DinB family protein [Thermomicrobiales bacterium]
MFDERAELIDANRAAPAILRALVRDVDGGRARERAGEGEWAVVEIVAHLADAEGRVIDRIARMTAEDAPVLVGYDQAALAEERGYLGMSLAAELDRFERLRAEHIAQLEGLDKSGWSRVGRHTEVGEITVQQLVAHMTKHDAIHLAQIARMIGG